MEREEARESINEDNENEKKEENDETGGKER